MDLSPCGGGVALAPPAPIGDDLGDEYAQGFAGEVRARGVSRQVRAVGAVMLVSWAAVRVHRQRDEDGSESGGVGALTGPGFSLLVGGPLLVLGALLLL